LLVSVRSARQFMRCSLIRGLLEGVNPARSHRPSRIIWARTTTGWATTHAATDSYSTVAFDATGNTRLEHGQPDCL